MRLLLTKSVPNLGNVGDIVRVKSGFGRNYLLPNLIAVPVTADNIRRIERERLRILEEENKKLEALRVKADKIGEMSVSFAMQASDKGLLYGSVTAAMIAGALEEQGVSLDAKSFQLDEPIKALGVYTVPVRLHPELSAELKVWVAEARPE